MGGQRVQREGRRGGFTLVELIVVTGIIVILAVVVVPRFLRARYNANESAAIATLKVYATELESYRSAQVPPTYPTNLMTLADADPPYVDSTMGQDPATRQGYVYTYEQVSGAEYGLTAEPEIEGVSGTRIFFVDESGIIRLDDENGEPIE